jgi:hypothetical protein
VTASLGFTRPRARADRRAPPRRDPRYSLFSPTDDRRARAARARHARDREGAARRPGGDVERLRAKTAAGVRTARCARRSTDS